MDNNCIPSISCLVTKADFVTKHETILNTIIQDYDVAVYIVNLLELLT